MRLLLLASAGGVGAGARYLSVGFMRWCAAEFWATLTINVVGCLWMGGLVAVFLRHWPEAPGLLIFVTPGILGGFTTFSACAMEVIALVESNASVAVALYIAGSIGLSIAACVFGLWLARATPA